MPNPDFITRTNKTAEEFDVKTRKIFTGLPWKTDKISLADVLLNLEKVLSKRMFYTFYFLFLNLHFYQSKLNGNKRVVKRIHIQALYVLVENKLRRGMSGVRWPRYVHSKEKRKTSHDDANIYVVEL